MLVDSVGRVATGLRVSVTDKCNLRCTYCMPPDGLDWIAGDKLLTASELVRVVRLAVDHGVQEVRFTGGEPLVRPDLEEIIAGVAALPDPPSRSRAQDRMAWSARGAYR